MESQRSRLFEELGKGEGMHARLSIEKMILDIDNKILNFISKFDSSIHFTQDNAVGWINKWAKKNGIDIVLTDSKELMYASKKTTDKIEKLLKEDLEQRREKRTFPAKN